MKMFTDVVVILIVALMVLAIILYLVKQKKQGATCIGCPYAKECGGHNCGCHEFPQSDKE